MRTLDGSGSTLGWGPIISDMLTVCGCCCYGSGCSSRESDDMQSMMLSDANLAGKSMMAKVILERAYVNFKLRIGVFPGYESKA